MMPGRLFTALALAAACFGPLFAKDAKIPESPYKIPYAPLDWKVPLGAPYRTALPGGLVAYIAEDRSLPLVSISGVVRFGDVADPPGKEGLCGFMARLMRTAGTRKYPPDSLDARIDLYALNVRVAASETEIDFSFSCLAEYLPACLDVMEQVLFHPAFDEKMMKKEMDIDADAFYHRFDNPAPTERAAYEKAMYSGQANSRLATEKTLRAITREDLITLHDKVFKTENIICAASGKFSKDTLAMRLNEIFPKTATAQPEPAFPAIKVNTLCKLLFVSKPITQSYVKMGLPLFKRPNPDYYAVSVLNLILGGESFTSRLGAKIRSNEGLTYSIHSGAESNYFFPGTFYIDFFTKSETTSRAIALALSEVELLKDKGVTEAELEHAKRMLIDGFPSMFRTPGDVVENYADNEYVRNPADHFAKYPGRINALTVADINAAAHKYLVPAAFTYTVVGDTSVIFKSDTVKGFSLRKLAPVRYVPPDSLPGLP